ncbi:MAG: DNA-binding LacI/PurR family transcriptional regulator [Verrucomicrobiales bacterium]|jgi:DNA-binding LacI/PurR family transcriptional regulator
MSQGVTSKHRAVYQFLRDKIESGEIAPRMRLPTEMQLVEQFSVSRPTASRALNDLVADGMIRRRAGSGSFVRDLEAGVSTSLHFGLIIPGLGETEIFEPICGAIAAAAASHRAGLVWGPGSALADASNTEGAAEVCRYFLDKDVDGIFFAPLEHEEPDFAQEVNQKIVAQFQKAEIPVILLDRDSCPFPERSNLDLVGINNYRAGYLLTQHLVNQGCQHVVFFDRPGSASTVDQRIGGYRQALIDARVEPTLDWLHVGDPENSDDVRAAIGQGVDAVVCANDRTAGRLLSTCRDLDIAIPDDILLGSFDDVKYAPLLNPPLTTIHQPCHEIGLAAFNAMTTRIADPALPPREISIEGKLIVRQSSGR